MENYRKKFIKKHNLTEEECDKYNDNDIMFDIDIELPEDAFEQWNEYKQKNGYISFSNWTAVDNHYKPKGVVNDNMDYFKNEMEMIYKNIENIFNNGFAPFYEELEDSDIDE